MCARQTFNNPMLKLPIHLTFAHINGICSNNNTTGIFTFARLTLFPPISDDCDFTHLNIFLTIGTNFLMFPDVSAIVIDGVQCDNHVFQYSHIYYFIVNVSLVCRYHFILWLSIAVSYFSLSKWKCNWNSCSTITITVTHLKLHCSAPLFMFNTILSFQHLWWYYIGFRIRSTNDYHNHYTPQTIIQFDMVATVSKHGTTHQRTCDITLHCLNLEGDDINKKKTSIFSSYYCPVSRAFYFYSFVHIFLRDDDLPIVRSCSHHTSSLQTH